LPASQIVQLSARAADILPGWHVLQLLEPAKE
jgi:hypothetical protein